MRAQFYECQYHLLSLILRYWMGFFKSKCWNKMRVKTLKNLSRIPRTEVESRASVVTWPNRPS